MTVVLIFMLTPTGVDVASHKKSIWLGCHWINESCLFDINVMVTLYFDGPL